MFHWLKNITTYLKTSEVEMTQMSVKLMKE